MFDVAEEKKSISNRNHNKKPNKKLDIQTKKILIICLSIFLIIFLFVYVYVRNQSENYNDIKLKKGNFLIYTKYEKSNTNYPVYVPYVNIKGDVIKKVNSDIDVFLGEFLRSKRCRVLYEYNISGIILSLVVKVIDYNTEYAPRAYFRSYNINLSTLEVISDDSLLDFFETDLNSVEALITNQFKYYYQELIEKEYFHIEECNYNCFLKYRDVSNYMDNVVYYVKDGDLIAYKPFVFHSLYGEENYFKEEDYKFMIVQTEKR